MNWLNETVVGWSCCSASFEAETGHCLVWQLIEMHRSYTGGSKSINTKMGFFFWVLGFISSNDRRLLYRSWH